MSDIKDRMAGEAFMLRMWSHTIGIINEKRRVRTLPSGRTLHEEQPGSASLVRWKQHHCILTAKHVVEDAGRDDLRFFLRPKDLERKTREEIERQGFVEFHKGLRADICEIYRCVWEDMAGITPSRRPVARSVGDRREVFRVRQRCVRPRFILPVSAFLFFALRTKDGLLRWGLANC